MSVRLERDPPLSHRLVSARLSVVTLEPLPVLLDGRLQAEHGERPWFRRMQTQTHTHNGKKKFQPREEIAAALTLGAGVVAVAVIRTAAMLTLWLLLETAPT